MRRALALQALGEAGVGVYSALLEQAEKQQQQQLAAMLGQAPRPDSAASASTAVAGGGGADGSSGRGNGEATPAPLPLGWERLRVHAGGLLRVQVQAYVGQPVGGTPRLGAVWCVSTRVVVCGCVWLCLCMWWCVVVCVCV